MEKRGDHRRKKFFKSNSVKALTLFNKERQGLLKVQVYFGW